MTDTRATSDADSADAAATPLWRRLLRAGPALEHEWRPIGGLIPQPPPPPEPAVSGEAQIVEGGEFDVHPVGEPAPSGFRYFLDGIEYTGVCAYVGVVPIVHGYVAAVVRERREREFRTWDVREEEVLAFPYSRVDPQELIALGLPEDRLLDSDREPAEHHPIALAENGRARIKRHREHLEAELARDWTRAVDDGCLLVDGGVDIHPELRKSGRAFGLVKSHRTQFLEPDHMTRVLRMEATRRSSVFKPVRPDIGEVYSWYLRLRPPAGHDIYWALARIEGAAAPDTVDAADEVSRWLLTETAPLAMPDARWDVLLYPIRDCETYLRARMPTLAV